MARKTTTTRMVQHRGLESESWGALPKDEPVVELYNPYWKKFGLPADLRISPLNKGEYGLIITDPTLMEMENKGGKMVPKEGGSNGFYVDDPGAEPTLEVLYALLDAGVKQNHGIALPMDEMYNRALDDDSRLTNTILRREQLTGNQLRNLKKHGLESLVNQPVSLGDFEKILGDVKDKEFYNFPEHSMEGKVVLLPKFAEYVKNQQLISTTGGGKSPIRLIPFQKDGLYPLVPPDERGQNSNHWDRIYEVWFSGRQGEEGRRERKVFVAGACIDYSVALTAQWQKDTGYDVTIFAPAVKGLGIIPKPVMMRNLAEGYGINITWDWPKEFGPEPKGWVKMQDKVRAADKAQFESASGPGCWADFVKSVNNYM